jgi:bifunctional UDP-N-acetylglucosamine pyrophosphorylase/glucosamine-1-phosphate N-acetyltransferase
VEIGQDTRVYPDTVIEGKTKIGKGCIIGPGSHIVDSVIGDDCRVEASVLEEAVLEDRVRVGPFSHLRAGAYLASDTSLGNYVEVKNSYLGRGTQMHHLGYIGDATVGEDVNVGAGTITCNYDRETKQKYRTEIEDGVALGSDTMLVAPVRIGKGAITGAGSVITKDIPQDSIAYGVPARVKRRGRKPSLEQGVLTPEATRIERSK